MTVTDPEVTRFFMTIPEACQLVIQAGASAAAARSSSWTWASRSRSSTSRERMIAMSGKQVDIVFTGLRAGEKMHEELLRTPARAAKAAVPSG